MKKLFILILVTFLSSSLIAQGVNFQWAKALKINTTGTGHFISVDGVGNVYTAGSFYNTTDFDPGPAVFNLVPNGQDDGFITKFDANGNFIWAKNVGGPIQDYITAIATDVSGNVYITGYFGGTADFDPGPGIFNLSCANTFQETDAFVCKLDYNGNFGWAKHIEGIGIEIPYSISLDALGNIYTTGFFNSNADFDPGSGIFAISANRGLFILKLDFSGNFTWVKALNPQNGYAYNNCVTSDLAGNVYITGRFESTVDFDPGPAVYNLTALPSEKNTYLLKLDAVGNFVYALTVGIVSPFASYDQSVALDAIGNAYVVWLNKLAKVSVSGNILWTKNIGGSVGDYSRAVSLDGNGNIFIAGSFWATVDFDPGPGVRNLTSFGYPTLLNHDSFILRLDNNGNFIWVQQIGGNTEDFAYSLFVDNPGNVYHTGSFTNTADFDPGPGSFILSSTGTSNYIHKMNRCTNITTSTITTAACNSYILNGQTYTASGTYTQTIMNVAGCDSIITLNLTINGSNTTTSVTACDSYIWQGQTYTLSGFYSDTLVSSTNCDSILNLNLTINYKVLSTFNVTICQGQVYAGYSTTGTYIDTFVASNGCDSVRTLHLTVTQTLYSNITSTICDDQDYEGYTASGIYVDTLISIYGCDSIRTLNLTVNPRAFSNVNASICEGQSYYAGGTNQTTTGIFKDTLLTSLGCDSIITTNLKVNPKPKPNLGPDGNICTNSQGSITPGLFNSYLWQDNSTLPDYIVTSTGKYWVTVADANNCSATDTLNVLSIDTIPKNFLPTDRQLCYGDVLKITVPNYSTYQWSTGSTAGTIEFSASGTYYLTVKDFNTCTGTDSITIQRKNCIFMSIPNAFTPDGNSTNDIFKPIINQAIQSFSFIVFNRYGQTIFETGNYTKGWDGSFKGKPQPSGSYVYRIKYTNIFGIETVENGSVLLIR